MKHFNQSVHRKLKFHIRPRVWPQPTPQKIVAMAFTLVCALLTSPILAAGDDNELSIKDPRSKLTGYSTEDLSRIKR